MILSLNSSLCIILFYAAVLSCMVASKNLQKDDQDAQYWDKEVTKDCGGLLAANTMLHYVSYYPPEGYPSNLRCVYGFKYAYYFEYLTFYVNSTSTSSGINGFTVFIGNGSKLIVNKVPPKEQMSYTYSTYFNPVYILFSSDTNGTGTGFSFAYQFSGGRYPFSGIDLFHSLPTGSGRSHLSNYTVNEKSTYIIQPPREQITTVELLKIDTERNADFLDIYSLVPYHAAGTSIIPIRFSGLDYKPSGSETSSAEPRILYFTSNNNNYIGNGFTYRWTAV